MIAALKELKVIKEEIKPDTAFIGTLSLDGTIGSAGGMLPALIAGKALGLNMIYLLDDPNLPIHMLQGLDFVVVKHIKEVVQHIQGQEVLSFLPNPLIPEQIPAFSEAGHKDFSHVISHEQAK